MKNEQESILESFKQPEQRLVIAIFQATLEDLVKLGPADYEYRRSLQWVLANDLSWPFSFVNLCDLLNFRPSEWRRLLCSARNVSQGQKLSMSNLIEMNGKSQKLFAD